MTKKMIALLAGVMLIASPAHAEEKKASPAKKPDTKVSDQVEFDADKDGKISLSEAKKLAEGQFALYDADKNGSMSVEEYRKPLDVISKVKKFSAAQKKAEENVVKESFKRMDNNADGGISKAEFLSDADLRHKTMDLDKDGFVTPKEVEELQKKIAAAHKDAKAEKKQ